MEQYNLTTDLGVIAVTGPDAAKFLQGQLTNDINALDTQPFQLSAHLNNKGRMLASLIITRVAPDTYHLITANEIINTLIPRLKMFVLRAKVNIVQYNCNILLCDQQHASNNYAIQFTPQYVIAVAESITNTIDSNNMLWKNILINHGIPLIYKNTQEEFTPQHVNFDLLGGVNFKKGCYIGQEIVARTHYLGKVKRRMYRFVSDFLPALGHKIVSPKLDNQEVGVIVDFVKRDFNYLGLVSIQTDCIEEAFLDIKNDQQLRIQPIEYGST